MKRLWARISMELEVSDEEYEQLREMATSHYDGAVHDLELDLMGEYGNELKQRFVEHGFISNDSYISDMDFYYEQEGVRK